jgi:hypothetical protein
MLLLVLPCTGVLVVGGYKLSREGTDIKSLRLVYEFECLVSEVCFDSGSSP